MSQKNCRAGAHLRRSQCLLCCQRGSSSPAAAYTPARRALSRKVCYCAYPKASAAIRRLNKPRRAQECCPMEIRFAEEVAPPAQVRPQRSWEASFRLAKRFLCELAACIEASTRDFISASIPQIAKATRPRFSRASSPKPRRRRSGSGPDPGRSAAGRLLPDGPMAVQSVRPSHGPRSRVPRPRRHRPWTHDRRYTRTRQGAAAARSGLAPHPDGRRPRRLHGSGAGEGREAPRRRAGGE